MAPSAPHGAGWGTTPVSASSADASIGHSALVTVYASCTGVSQTQAARALVRAAPVMKEIPAIPEFLENPVAREFVRSLIGEMGMRMKAKQQSALDDIVTDDAL